MPKKQLELFDQEPDHGESLSGKKSASQNPPTGPCPDPGSGTPTLPTSAIERAEALRKKSYQLKFKSHGSDLENTSDDTF